ncbi:acyl-CoA desaturase [[Limnothrix rosea] IAM M-220]|uniref:acyl-CoA desaturase n=1 Tax=[Limnothrix rosea] IAM M-220 TaxID=454133 RepID=UPI000965365C|nr:acyl-CoA desaturase [[Limnothrix rosea] IAM M-220]OKH19500.1 acyl-CoA desaturase [[Limnothrix rosea] IAM M-220]
MTVATSKKLSLDWTTVIYFSLIHIVALLAFLPSNFSWQAVGVCLLFHWITGGIGITLGFHRLVSHRSFQVPKLLEYFLVFCGTLACQGGPLDWIGLHRIHHKHSDDVVDPHNSLKGFWWSHIGWMLFEIPARSLIERYTRDINQDPFYRFCQNFMVPIQVVLGLLLFAWGGWPFVIWGIFVRLVVVFHCTWFVNSATHKFGYVSNEANDTSRNCWWVALLTYGEGWHNNHHAFEYSARHGLNWWELDITWMTINLLKMLGLAKKIKLPPTMKDA